MIMAGLSFSEQLPEERKEKEVVLPASKNSVTTVGGGQPARRH